MNPRTLKRLTVSTAAGSDPDVIESLDDCHEAYGDGPFGEVIERCILSPIGQCQYSHHDGYENCVHCGKGECVL